jgi:NAD-dependent SIR2 family protein deacetylase
MDLVKPSVPLLIQVVIFGDNVPKARAEEAMAMAKSSDAILVLGSSLMVMSAFRLIRYYHNCCWLFVC